ncbi:GTP-binding GUF1-like protein [Hordeum vulgare]|nr:GTP-binding GUF1-like protein [Hordeum vulgare]
MDSSGRPPGSMLAQRLCGLSMPLIECDDCPRQVMRLTSGTQKHPGWVFYKWENNGEWTNMHSPAPNGDQLDVGGESEEKNQLQLDLEVKTIDLDALKKALEDKDKVLAEVKERSEAVEKKLLEIGKL